MHPTLFLVAALAPAAMALDIPENLQKFYDEALSTPCPEEDMLQGGFYDQMDGPQTFGYCARGLNGKGFYLSGPNGLVNMDIDCDGINTPGDGRCAGSSDTQYQTRWKAEVQESGKEYNIDDLNTYVHPYVVFGNEGSYEPTFDPQEHDIKPLSLVAVVCGDKLVYGVWGDTNGDDGPPLIGETSLALATECFGNEMNADIGYSGEDVLYIAFPGEEAVPDSTVWAAESYDEFVESIKDLGDKLVSQLGESPYNSANVSSKANGI